MRDSHILHTIIFANFLLSVLALIAYFVWLIYMMPETTLDKAKLAPLFGCGTMIWLLITRYKDHEGHAFALIIGIPIIAYLLIGKFYDIDIPLWTNYLGAYIGISHIIYAFTNTKQLLRGLKEKGDGWDIIKQ